MFALLKDQSLSGTYKLTGVLKEVGEYSEQYGNIEAVMTVDGRDIIVFRMKKGTSPVELGTLAVGDTITVVGTLKDYGGKKEFDAGCTLENVVRDRKSVV